MKKIIFCTLILLVWGLELCLANPKTINDKQVQLIYDKLTAVVGDYSQTLPKVKIRPQKRFGASYKRSENTIFIDQAALDICAAFGTEAASAIAFLLGHELTHYYQKHDWQEAGFTTGFLMTQETFQKHIQHEKEADTYSAFISHLAGYNSIKILPTLLDKIYEAYNLKGKALNTYPPLAERKTLANKVCKTVQGLIDIYQAANYLYLLGKYEEALVNYEYVLNFVKYKELYNNRGLSALYAVLPLVQRAIPLAHPLTLDPTVPLRAPSTFTKEELIQKAISSFSTATTYDASYFLSYLNLVCTYDIANQFQAARQLLNKLQQLAVQPKQQQQLALIEGVLAFRGQNKTIAENHFLSVSKDSRFPELANMAKLNLDLINGKTLNNIIQPTIPFPEDKIEAINLLFFEGDRVENSYLLRDRPLG